MSRSAISASIAFLMLSLGVCTEATWAQTNKSIDQAAVDGDVARVKELLDKGTDINTRNRMDYTPLLGAARNGRKEVVDLLLSKGADINAKERSGKTALFLAVEFGHKEIVQVLLDKGADINVVTGRGENAFSMAKKTGNTEIVGMLAKKGATDPVVQDAYGEGLYESEAMMRPGPGGISPLPATAASVVQAAVQVDLLADPNEIKARVKTFPGLEKELQDVGVKSSREQRYWEQTRSDNRTSLSSAVEKQVEDELTLVKKVAVEEKAQKTTEAITALMAKKQEQYKRVSRELVQQRRETMATQSSRGGRTRSSARSSGRGYSSGYSASGGYGGADSGLYDDAGAPGTSGRDRYGRASAREEEPVDRETEEEIRRWLQATVDNKPELARMTNDQIYAELALVRTVAVIEEAKKTTAAIDGILLARQERFAAYMKKIEQERAKLAPGQDPRAPGQYADPTTQQGVRARAGRTRGTVGGTQQQTTQRTRGRRR